MIRTHDRIRVTSEVFLEQFPQSTGYGNVQTPPHTVGLQNVVVVCLDDMPGTYEMPVEFVTLAPPETARCKHCRAEKLTQTGLCCSCGRFDTQ